LTDLFGAPRRFAALLTLALVTSACGGPNTLYDRTQTCDTFDSLYSQAGFEAPLRLVGSARVDAEQHQLRGKVDLQIDGSTVFLAFASTILFGASREDFFFSLVGDTLRIVDRERAQYYEADDAEAFLSETFGMGSGSRTALGLAMGRPPECSAIDDLEMKLGRGGEVRFEGKVAGASFKVEFGDDRRLRRLEWPLKLEDGDDRLDVSYDWQQKDGRWRLREITMWLADREWRCIITASG